MRYTFSIIQEGVLGKGDVWIRGVYGWRTWVCVCVCVSPSYSVNHFVLHLLHAPALGEYIVHVQEGSRAGELQLEGPL